MKHRSKLTRVGMLAAVAMLAGPARADTASGSLGVSMTVTKGCSVGVSSNVSFGSQSSFASNIDAAGAVNVTCTSTTLYSVGLDAGAGTGATVSSRKMSGTGSNVVGYALYSDAGRSINWGNTVGSDTVAGTGNGAAQTLLVYARVPAGTAPAPDFYADTIDVTVTY